MELFRVYGPPISRGTQVRVGPGHAAYLSTLDGRALVKVGGEGTYIVDVLTLGDSPVQWDRDNIYGFLVVLRPSARLDLSGVATTREGVKVRFSASAHIAVVDEGSLARAAAYHVSRSLDLAQRLEAVLMGEVARLLGERDLGELLLGEPPTMSVRLPDMGLNASVAGLQVAVDPRYAPLAYRVLTSLLGPAARWDAGR